MSAWHLTANPFVLSRACHSKRLRLIMVHAVMSWSPMGLPHETKLPHVWNVKSNDHPFAASPKGTAIGPSRRHLRTAANGCGWLPLRDVWQTHWHPQPPDPKSEMGTRLAHSAIWFTDWLFRNNIIESFSISYHTSLFPFIPRAWKFQDEDLGWHLDTILLVLSFELPYDTLAASQHGIITDYIRFKSQDADRCRRFFGHDCGFLDPAGS